MRQVRSTTETSEVGTRKAIPVSLPLRLGITLPTALAAPVADGMMLAAAVRPPRQSFLLGPSTVFCVAVYECTVVIRPSMMLYFSWITLASGDRQLVVHDALLQRQRLISTSAYRCLTTVGVCLPSLFYRDYSSRPGSPKSLQGITSREYWSRNFTGRMSVLTQSVA